MGILAGVDFTFDIVWLGCTFSTTHFIPFCLPSCIYCIWIRSIPGTGPAVLLH